MRKTFGYTTGLCVFLTILPQPLLSQPVRVKDQPVHPTRILARHTERVSAQAVTRAIQAQGLVLKDRLVLVPGLVVLETGDAKAATLPGVSEAQGKRLLEQMEALRQTGLFQYVEPDYLVYADRTPEDSAFTDGTLWGLRNTGQSGGISGADIGAVAAWDITTGSTNVLVAVIDTGIRYTHQDLAARMWHNPGETPGNGIDDDNNGYVDDIYGINAINGSGNPMDDNDHGSHCAGTIGAAANNGRPHVGVAWEVRLMACKFLDADGSGSTGDAVKCVQYAVAKGARILSNSWGGGAASEALQDAIRAARDQGVLFVAAAGNDGEDADLTPHFPSSYDVDNIIGVAALDRQDALASFSNYGAQSVHLGAPGVAIYSSTSGSDSEYQTFNGTSMATPHVSGVASLLIARFPEISLGELRQRLLATVVPVPALLNRTTTGGRVNAYNALSATPDGTLEVSVSSGGGDLQSGRVSSFFVRVNDLEEVTNATVTATVAGLPELVFRNDGSPPDMAALDAIYSTQLTVLSNITHLLMTVAASAPGKTTCTNTFDFPVVTPPPNDWFADRIEIVGTNAVATGSNVGASKEPGEPNHAGNSGGHSVWWTWTAPTNGSVMIHTSGSSYDTTLGVYTGTSVSGLSVVAGNDDSGGGTTSSVSFDVTAGQSYQIAVDGYSGARGDIRLQVNLTSAGGRPFNDMFADRVEIVGVSNRVFGVNRGATKEPGEPMPAGNSGGKSVWWTWTAPADGSVTIRTDGSGFDTTLGVYTGTSVSALSLVAEDDDSGEGTCSLVRFTASSGVAYQIAVDGYSGSAGDIQLTVAQLVVQPPPDNDPFASRVGFTGLTNQMTGTNVSATKESGEPNHAENSGGKSVWWTWTAPAEGDFRVSTAGSSFDTLLGVYTGDTVSALSLVAANDNAAGGGLTSGVSFYATNGMVCQIAVDGNNQGFGAAEGAITLTLGLLPETAPSITTQPAGQTVLAGRNASFRVVAAGSSPLSYQWWNDQGVLPGATQASLVLPNVTALQAGSYWVVVSNRLGSVTSSSATLSVVEPAGDTFRITRLGTANSRSIDHDALTGDDRGGIAASSSQVFVTGDNATARFASDDLGGGTSLGQILNGLVSDLRTETVYALGNGDSNIGSDGGTITTLFELDDTGTRTGNRIDLSSPVFASSGSGLFAGYGRVVIHNGTHVYDILLPSGLVTDLGAMSMPVHQASESWAFWGVAEFFQNSVSLGYVRDSQTIVRTRVPGGQTTALAQFTNLSDMASFTVLPSRDRWYFHHEDVSQFGGAYETLGYAEAEFTFADVPASPTILEHPRSRVAWVGGSAAFQVTAEGSFPLHFQWYADDGPIAGAISSTLELSNLTTNESGSYWVVVTNAVGSATSSNALLTVMDAQAGVFQILELGTTGSQVVDHDSLTGDDRGGIAVSASQVLVTGDSATARFQLDDLSDGTSLGGILDGLVSDLQTETVYALGNGSAFIGNSGGTITSLLELDDTGTWTGNRIDLSSPISAGGGSGVFAGYGRITIHNGTRVYDILLPSGLVTDLGAMSLWGHHTSENWAFWGIAEFFDSAIHLVYVRDSATIVRTRVPDGVTTVLATFANLSDMASFTVSPRLSRWYFHYEYDSQFGGSSETLGYADAQFSYAVTPAPPSILTQPTNQTVVAGGTASFRVRAQGSHPLAYQWWNDRGAIPEATNATLTLTNVTLELAGPYWVVVTNTLGGTTSSNALLTVIPMPTLAEALDAPELTWTTGGDASWFPQLAEAHDGLHAGRSGAIGHSQASWAETTVVGPGFLSFWWRVSSESCCDPLSFYLDGSGQADIRGGIDWTQRSYSIPDGRHTLRWVYSKDGSVVSGLDAAWLDQVSYVPARGVLHHFTWSALAPTQQVNVPFSVVLTAQDAMDGLITNFGGTVHLRATSTTNAFSDGFEDGDYTGWQAGSGAYTRQVTTQTAARGLHSLTLIGGNANDHYDGLSHPLPNLTPSRLQCYVRASSSTGSGGYVVAGTAPDRDSVAVFFYMEGDGLMGLYDGNTFHGVPYQPGRWYQIAFAFDWVNRQVAYYVDNLLVESGIPFRAPVSHLSGVYLYNYDNTQAWWDEIEIGSASTVAIAPTVSDPFVGGSWTGALTVLEPASELWLIAEDDQGHTGMSQPFAVVPGPTPLRLRPTPSHHPAGLQWTLEGPAGGVVNIQTSTNLVNWTDWFTLVNTSGTIDFIDSRTNLPRLFYKAWQAR